MLLDALRNHLNDEIAVLLEPLSDSIQLYDLVKESLSKINRYLDSDAGSSVAWFLLPLTVCEAVCGRYEHAIPVCVGLELLKASAEVFDDIEDADSAESLVSKHGLPLATNTASMLLILAEKAFSRLSLRSVDPDTIVRVIDTVNSYYTTACKGQHLDLSLAPTEAATEEVYLKVIGLKSASSVECACHTGALLAGAMQEPVELFIGLGHNLGMSTQIANDIKGITSLKDVDKRKITLPLIYALNHADGRNKYVLQEFFFNYKDGSEITSEQIKKLLFDTGAMQYVTIKMEMYNQRAENILTELENANVNTEKLKLFLL